MVRFFQYAFYAIFHPIFSLVFRAEIFGTEHIPERPFILASNHTAKIDPFLLCLLPLSAAKRMIPIHFLTTDVYYQKWQFRPFIKVLGAYPVRRKSWTLEQFLSPSIEKLRQGLVIMFFPEGKIIKTERERARPGISYLLEQSKKPILPLRIAWGGVPMKTRRIRLTFGSPITMKDLEGQSPAEQAEEIMDKIYSLE